MTSLTITLIAIYSSALTTILPKVDLNYLDLRAVVKEEQIESISFERNWSPQAISDQDKVSSDKENGNKEKASFADLSTQLKSTSEALLYIALVLVLCIGCLFLLALMFGIIQRGAGTIIIPFKDLRESKSIKEDAEGVENNPNVLENKKDKKELEKIDKVGDSIAELLIAKLHEIRHIHELANQNDEKVELDVQVPSTDASIDVKSFYTDILIGGISFPRIKSSADGLIGNIGEITTVGPLAAKLSLAQLMLFLQRIWPDFLSSSKRRVITGSLHEHSGHLRLIAHVEQGKRSWAWELTKNTVQACFEERDEIPLLVEKLAYTISNTLSSQPLSLVCNFKRFTDALSAYNTFKQVPTSENLENAIILCLEFLNAEPNDTFSFGLLYNLGIAALLSKKLDKAEKLFRYAISLEPSIVQQLFEKKVLLGHLKWDKKIKSRLFDQYLRGITRYQESKSSSKLFPHLGRVIYHIRSRFRYIQLALSPHSESCSEYMRIETWASGISYVLNGLGEALQENTVNSSDSNNLAKNQAKIYDAMEAFGRASKYAIDDALSPSNLGALMIEKINYVSTKDYLKEIKLREAEKLLLESIEKCNKNRHLAYNRLGNLYRDQGNYVDAIKNFENALDEKSDFVVAYRNLGLIYCEQLDFPNSLKAFSYGLEMLSDSQIFQGDMTFQQWHAWLHNGQGYTYLVRAFHGIPSTVTQRSIVGDAIDDDLTCAEKEFQEAIKIFEECNTRNTSLYFPLHIPQFNIGLVYALRGNPEQAFEAWKKPHCYEDHMNACIGNISLEMISIVYNFVNFTTEDFEEPNLSRKIDEASTSLEKLFNSDKSHWLIRYFSLEDARLLKKAFLHQCFQEKSQSLTSYINALIATLEKHLPSFYLGLAYIWKEEYQCAIDRWRSKIKKIDGEISSKGDEGILHDQYFVLSARLWKYIYQGLVIIVCDSINADTPGSCKSTVDELANKIEQCLKSLEDSCGNGIHADQAKILSILEDIRYKHNILKKGPKIFGSSTEKLNKLFMPIEIKYDQYRSKRLFEKVLGCSKLCQPPDHKPDHRNLNHRL